MLAKIALVGQVGLRGLYLEIHLIKILLKLQGFTC